MNTLQETLQSYINGSLNDKIDKEYIKTTFANNNSNKIKLLYYLGLIDIHMDNELAFRWACAHGDLEQAKWIYSLGNTDIHAMQVEGEAGYNGKDEAFFYSCIYDNLQVAQWLYSLGNIPKKVINDVQKRSKSDWFVNCPRVLKWLSLIVN